MVNYNVSARAYAKMILHSAKYPHCAINGVLITKMNSANNTIEIVDAMPLFHQCLYVTPMAEIALLNAETFANESNLQIGGYYAACELYLDKTVDKAPAVRIADRIAENVPNAAFIVLSNILLSTESSDPALNIWQHKENQGWVQSTCEVDNLEQTLDAVDLLIERGAMKDLQDYDNHLDDLKNDWTNEHFNQDLQKLLSMY